MADKKTVKKEIEVEGKELWKKVKELIKEGNLRKIVIKKSNGEVFLTVPVTIGVIATLFAPVLVALGAVGAMTDMYKLELIRKEEKVSPTKAKAVTKKAPVRKKPISKATKKVSKNK